MHEADFAPEAFVPCAPVFIETVDGYVLTAEAQAYLDPPAPTIAERLVSVRSALLSLARDLPAVVREMAPHDLLDAVEVLQQATNVAGACDQTVVAEIDRQDVRTPCGATSTAQLLSDHLRIRPAEAKRRVVTARACSERVSLDGQVLPPLRPHVAAAQAAGTVSPDHAGVITRALDSLRSGIPVDIVDAVERALVELAGKRHATDVATAGRGARDRFDDDPDPDNPDPGVNPREQRQRRHRGISAFQRDNGLGALRGTLTPVLLAKLLAVLSPLAAPRPTDANGEDTRSYEQRLHDALEDVCDRLLRSGTLPDSGGVPTTVAVTVSETRLRQRTGRVTTTLGVDLSYRQFLQIACEADIIPVYLNDAGGIMAHGRTKRYATAAQTKALRARDRGCAFPRCRRPPEWCDRHHIRQWIDLGGTDIGNLCLLCSYHHQNFESWGWTVEMTDGVPRWIPPAYLDPARRPLVNTAHDVSL